MDFRQLLGVERALLAGVLSDEAWNNALMKVADLAGASYLAVMSRDEEAGLFHIVEPVTVSSRVIEDYENEFKVLNPMNSMKVLTRDGDHYLDWVELGHDFIGHSPYYQEFMRVHGLGHIMAYRVDSFGSGTANYLSIHKQVNEVAFRIEDAAGLSAVHGALSRTFALREHLQGLQQMQVWQRAALDALRFPVMIIDAAGAVQQANHAAESWLLLPDCPLSARSSNANRQALQGVLRRARGSADEAPCLASVRLSGDCQHQGMVCVAMPIGEGDEGLSLRHNAVLLLVLSADPRAPVDGLLQQVFGLSPAEVGVAELLALGHTPREISMLRSRGEATVRSHIKSIFRKMHVSRQHDLARILAELGLVAPRSGSLQDLSSLESDGK